MASAELLHSAFERQAGRTPARVAVSLGPRSLTYAQLACAAHALSVDLQAAGVGAGAVVGVCAQRSPELVIALLGVLKAGAAYLALDCEDPPQRRALMASDARCPLVLAEAAACAQLAPRLEVPVVELRSWCEPVAVAETDVAKAGERARGADLAYVIYTSGSTGRPKGVMATHRGIVNRLRWMQRRYRLDARGRVLHKTSPAFDVSLWELFWPLSVGARLVLAHPGDQRHPRALADTICAERVTVAHFVPAMLMAFIAAGELERCASLRTVICSGEALTGQVRDLFHAGSGAALHNLYGPAEASVDVAHHTCRRGEVCTNVPIGRAIENVELRVLDERQRQLVDGAEGEICIAGVALARGYLASPGLTAERFVPDPRGDGTRLYRTGDRGRVGAGGELEFLGRLDGQVKIRGVRVELAEVEAALAAVPGVERCAVAPHGGEHPQLTAYVAGAPRSTEHLREQLAQTLPAQAVPSRFVYLERLPALVSGKIDRSALIALVTQADAAAPTTVRPPRELTGASSTSHPVRAPTGVCGNGAARVSATETTLARIWREVLGIGEVCESDNFFALGGDSIRSIEVVARARSAGLELTTHDIFARQTLGELARTAGVTRAVNGRGGPPAEPFALIAERDRDAMPNGVCDATPLSSLLAGLVAESFSNAHYRVYTTTLAIEGRYHAHALRKALATVVERHDFLRSAVDVNSFDEPLRLVYECQNVAVREVDVRSLSKEAARRSYVAWLAHERRARFDWASPPLLRVTVHMYDEEHWRLTLSEPFLDGWSATLVLAELLESYRARLCGQRLERPPAARSANRDVVVAERAALRSVTQQSFWKDYVAGGETRLPRLAEEGRGTRRPLRVEVALAEHVARGLGLVAKDLGVPLKSALLAAHVWVLAALTAQHDVRCGLMVNARPEGSGGELAVGLFLNTLPLRIRVERGSWAALIRATHAAEAQVLPWRHYPYAQIVRDAGGRTPIDSVFNFTHFHPYASLSAAQTPSAVRLSGVEGFDQTYLPLTAQFRIDPFKRGTVELALEVNPDGFAEAQIEQLVDLHERALAAIAGGVDAPHHTLASIGASESARRLRWSTRGRMGRRTGVRSRGGVRPCEGAARLEDLFELRVRRTPDALAVFDDRERLTYEQLDARALELARAITVRCARPPQRIGICVARSPALFAAILAALRTGATFVPLDPSLPARRLHATVEAAGPDLVLLDGVGADALRRVRGGQRGEALHVAHALPARTLVGERAASAERVRDAGCASSAARAEGVSDAGCASSATPCGSHEALMWKTAEDPAHILFTSGSTGAPRGVLTSHAAVVNRLRWMWRAYPLRAGEVLCSQASIGFVDALTEIFTGLLAGVPTYTLAGDLDDPDRFARALGDAGVTRVTLVPALLRVLLWRCDSDRRARLAGIEQWVLSGEPLDGELLAALRRIAPRARVLNLYGSTEVAGDVTVHECGVREPGLVPAGLAIDGVDVRVLDQYGRDAPCGTIGEIAVEGAALAAGYVDDPRATAERFRPAARGLGRRMLRTGDLGRHRPDGVLEVLGRRDRQVKVNGMRVEPAEVEATLLSHPLVRACAVVAAPAGSGVGQRLLAHVEATSEIDGAALRGYLRKRLPSAMVPSAMRFAAKLPRTESGKIDLGCLAVAHVPAPRVSTGGTELECTVARCMAAELGVQTPTVDDDFFELGGDSLGAVRLLARLRERFGIELALREIFDHPTVGELSGRIDLALGPV
jgi:amino acid adenylation domain-containing protein